MLKGAHMTQRNRYKYTISIDDDLVYSGWGRETFSLSMAGLSNNS